MIRWMLSDLQPLVRARSSPTLRMPRADFHPIETIQASPDLREISISRRIEKLTVKNKRTTNQDPSNCWKSPSQRAVSAVRQLEHVMHESFRTEKNLLL
eukprot:s1282_g11.t1